MTQGQKSRDVLPALPKAGHVNQGLDFAYSAGQMREYAREAVALALAAQKAVPARAMQLAPLTGRTHELKTDSPVFSEVVAGRKLFEIRKDDRGFQCGDLLRLRETRFNGAEMAAGEPLIYTGGEQAVRVIGILHGPKYGLADGWVIMSIAAAPSTPPSEAEQAEAPCAVCGGNDWLPGCFANHVPTLCLTCLGNKPVPIPLWERVVEEFAGLLQQVEVFCLKHGEADFEIGNALKVIGEAIDFEGQREATLPPASKATTPAENCAGLADCNYIDGLGRTDCDLCNPASKAEPFAPVVQDEEPEPDASELPGYAMKGCHVCGGHHGTDHYFNICGPRSRKRKAWLARATQPPQQPEASGAGERVTAGGGFAGDHNGVLTARIKELEGIVEKLTNSECDKIMAMTDAQISALHRMEGHDPEDIAKLGQLTARLAIRDVQVAQLRATLPPASKADPVAPVVQERDNYLEKIYGYLCSTAPEGYADEAFRIVPDSLLPHSVRHRISESGPSMGEDAGAISEHAGSSAGVDGRDGEAVAAQQPEASVAGELSLWALKNSVKELTDIVLERGQEIGRLRAALASKPPAGEQKPVFQWRTKGCADWYDGHPDPEDGGGPYETRTLYTAPHAQGGSE